MAEVIVTCCDVTYKSPRKEETATHVIEVET